MGCISVKVQSLYVAPEVVHRVPFIFSSGCKVPTTSPLVAFATDVVRALTTCPPLSIKMFTRLPGAASDMPVRIKRIDSARPYYVKWVKTTPILDNSQN